MNSTSFCMLFLVSFLANTCVNVLTTSEREVGVFFAVIRSEIFLHIVLGLRLFYLFVCFGLLYYKRLKNLFILFSRPVFQKDWLKLFNTFFLTISKYLNFILVLFFFYYLLDRKLNSFVFFICFLANPSN